MSNNDSPIIAVFNDWGTVAELFDGLGARVLDIEHSHEVSRAVKNADAIVLTGGGDVDPSRYGISDEDRHAQVYGTSTYRDDTELAALHLARKYRVPVLGICRGHQLINVSWGGTLHQHLSDGVEGLHKHECGDHDVKLRHNSFIARQMRANILREVTSLHHQAVDRLGNGLVPVGWATDGTVEMIETAPGVKPYMLGTQFHPEIDASMTKKPQYNAMSIFQAIYKKAQQHCASVGGSNARFAEVDDLEVYMKLQYSGRYASTTIEHGTPSQLSVASYLDNIPGTGSEDNTAYWEDHESEDSYEDWQHRNRMQLSKQAIRTSEYTIEKADSICALNSGCKSPMDCLAYGDCAADVMKGVVHQVVRGASK